MANERRSITKSRAGHYTVTITDENGRNVFRRNLLPSLFRAQEILREETRRIGDERAARLLAERRGFAEAAAAGIKSAEEA